MKITRKGVTIDLEQFEAVELSDILEIARLAIEEKIPTREEYVFGGLSKQDIIRLKNSISKIANNL